MITLEGQQVIRHRMEAFRLAPERLHDRMHAGRELAHLSDEPLQRACRGRAEDTHELSRRPGRADQIRQREARAEEHPPHPAHAPERVERVPHGDPGRDREAVAEVALAPADDRHVDGEDQRPVPRAARPLDEGAREVAILPDVQLEPEQLAWVLRV